MGFQKITENVENISLLSDTPAMTSTQLKQEFDKGNKIIKEAFNNLIDELNNNLFPIGYRIFINSDADYSNYLGFTWQKVAKGKVLVGKDENDEDFDTLGNTGGEKEHTLTIQEMPSHNHGIKINIPVSVQQYSSGTPRWPYQDDDNIHKWTESTGGNQSHNNLQPYEVVNIWERIS